MLLGRLGDEDSRDTRTPISVEQVKEWLSSSTTVLVRSVVDLAGCPPTDSYEIPDRIRRQVTTRDHHCTYPHCTKPAATCDLDHVQPHDQGGATCGCNLAPLCRGHHRMKTASQAQYRMLHPGTYLWTLPSGTYVVDATGTYHLSPPPPPDR